MTKRYCLIPGLMPRIAHPLVGLDIGSTAIRIAVGNFVGSEKMLHIVGAAEAPAEGVHKGIITSIEDAISSLSACIEKCERMVGVPLQGAWVGVSGTGVLAGESKGVVAVSRANGEISEEDVARAIEQARTVAMPLNHEILHVIPRTFTVDGQSNVKDPLGMTGVRLEVDAHIIQVLSSQMKNITRAVYRTGLDIEDLVLGILAAGEAVATERQRELGVAVVNVGGSTTSIVVYEEGELITLGVVPIGSEHITADIAIGLRTSIDAAERVKLEHGHAMGKEASKREMIQLADCGAEVEEEVSRKYVCEIIEARVEEILEKIDGLFKRVGRSGRLPAGVLFVGGGVKLPGFVDFAKKTLKLPAAMGYPLGVGAVTDKVNDVAFAQAVGLVRWGAHEAGERKGGMGKLMGRFKSVDQVPAQIKKWIQSLLP